MARRTSPEKFERRISKVEEEASKLRRFAQELKESEEQYAKLVENSLTGIYIDQDGRIVFANDRLAKIYSYAKEELIGIESWRLVHPEDRALTDKRRARRLRGERVPSEYEARGLTKQGRTIWIRRRNTNIEYQGKPAILGNAVEITRQKRAEEELRRKNEQLQNFIRVVSHDLKTPLISVQGFSSRLLRHYGERLGKRGRTYLEHIMASGHQMETLVSDLRTWARIGRIVYRVAADLQHQLKERNIELALAESFPVITCDEDRIYQVFQNLLSNTIKFAATVDKPRIEIGYRDQQDLHQFYVKDNGIGIAAKDHRRIFEMFQQAKRVKGQEGTGLGLAIVQRIVTDHGGNVWVDSEKGKGATFYFTLPKNLTPNKKT
jgi:PAS domain S-box-containing protein